MMAFLWLRCIRTETGEEIEWRCPSSMSRDRKLLLRSSTLLFGATRGGSTNRRLLRLLKKT